MRRCCLLVFAVLLAGCASLSDEGTVASTVRDASLEPGPAEPVAPVPDATVSALCGGPGAVNVQFVRRRGGRVGSAVGGDDGHRGTNPDAGRPSPDLSRLGERQAALTPLTRSTKPFRTCSTRRSAVSRTRRPASATFTLQGLGDIERDAAQGVGWLGRGVLRGDVAGHPELLQRHLEAHTRDPCRLLRRGGRGLPVALRRGSHGRCLRPEAGRCVVSSRSCTVTSRHPSLKRSAYC